MIVFYKSCPECGVEYLDYKSGEAAYFEHDELGEEDSDRVFITPESCFSHVEASGSAALAMLLDE